MVTPDGGWEEDESLRKVPSLVSHVLEEDRSLTRGIDHIDVPHDRILQGL